MTLFIQQFVNGIALGSVYSLVALGLTLVYGVLKVPNFAHGALYMAGAYTVWVVYAENNLPFFVAVLAAALVVIVIGLLMEVALFRPLRGNMLGGLIVSIGMLFILQVLAVHFFGEIGRASCRERV